MPNPMSFRRKARREARAAQPLVVEDLLAPLNPASVEIKTRHLLIGSHAVATLVVTGYPAEVTPGWLAPLLNFPGRLDVAVHIEPVPTPVAAQHLKRQRARLESARRSGYSRGQLDDPEGEAAAADAAELAYRIARGESRLFRVGLYLTIHATDEQALAQEMAAVRAVAESLLMTVQPTTFRALPGWLTSLPLGLDTVGMRRTFDTAALAACFPFTSPDLPMPTDPATGSPAGVLLGVTTAAGAPVFWDRFAQDNYNSITLARSGVGKSYLTKLELLRLLFTGVHAAVIDPEDEYLALAESVAGQVLRLGAPGVRINPFDLPTHPAGGDGGGGGDVLVRRVLFLHTFLSVLLTLPFDAAQREVLDRALLAVYERAGITTDSTTWNAAPPVLADLHTVLVQDGDPVAADLAARLIPFVRGSHAGLFNGPTTHRPEGHLVVFALRQLPQEVRAPAMLLTLDALWRRIAAPGGAPGGADRRQRHLVVVDEAWLLMQQEEGARFLMRMAKAGRKHWCGLAVVTQDADDVLASPLGRAVVANSATQFLLRQAPQAIDRISETFQLSRGERDFLLSARKGELLLLAGPRQKAALLALAGPSEHRLITTDPAELASAAEEVTGP